METNASPSQDTSDQAEPITTYNMVLLASAKKNIRLITLPQDIRQLSSIQLDLCRSRNITLDVLLALQYHQVPDAYS